MSELDHQKLPTGEEVWKSDRCELRIRVPARHLVSMRVSGVLESAFVPCIRAPVDRIFAAGMQPSVFNDWWAMTGYDSDTRLQLTDWVIKNRKRFLSAHILVQSKMVAMGVSVANLALGGFLTVYTDRTRFEFDLQRCLKQGPQ